MSRRKYAGHSLEDRMEKLSELRQDPDSPQALEALRKTLASRQAFLAGRAARMAGEFGRSELVPDMIEAFDRFMESPVESDKGCVGKTEIAKALIEMEHPATGLFLRGVRHVQMEPAYGGAVDAAVDLRANCAIGLVNSGYPGAVLELVPRLVDAGLPVRLAAAQAIAVSGQVEAEAVLRFKVLTGDEEPEVLAEAMAGLLRLAPERSLEFVEPFLRSPGSSRRDSPDQARREAAILALGESRLEAAVPLLCREWERAYDRVSRRTVLLALVASRREPALDFLLSLVADGDPPAARETITALAIHRHDEKIRERVKTALEANENRGELGGHFRSEFS